MIIKGLQAATTSVMWTMMLLFGFIYAFGVVFTALAKGNDKLAPWFGNIGLSMWTLLINGTFLDDVGEMLVPVRLASPGLSALFIVFTFISALAVLNLLVGVLCDVVSRTKQAEHNNSIATFVRHRMLEILECHDTDDDGNIEKSEFELLMQNPEMHKILSSCNISPKTLEDPLMLDGILFSRYHGEDGEVYRRRLSYDQLVDIVLRLSGGAAATIADLNDLRDFMRERLAQIESTLRKRVGSVNGQPGLHREFSPANSPPPELAGPHAQHASASMEKSPPKRPASAPESQRPAESTASASSAEEQPAWAKELMKQIYGVAEKQRELQEEVGDTRADEEAASRICRFRPDFASVLCSRQQDIMSEPERSS